jgi:hypothetical protein
MRFKITRIAYRRRRSAIIRLLIPIRLVTLCTQLDRQARYLSMSILSHDHLSGKPALVKDTCLACRVVDGSSVNDM